MDVNQGLIWPMELKRDPTAPFFSEVSFHNEHSPGFYWGNDADFK